MEFLVSDRDKLLTSEFVHDLLGIDQRMSSAVRPDRDRQTEGAAKSGWDGKLPCCELAVTL